MGLAVRHTTALALLDLEPNYGADDVRRAYVNAVKKMHPDAGGKGGDINALTQARDVLLQTLRSEVSCGHL